MYTPRPVMRLVSPTCGLFLNQTPSGSVSLVFITVNTGPWYSGGALPPPCPAPGPAGWIVLPLPPCSGGLLPWIGAAGVGTDWCSGAPALPIRQMCTDRPYLRAVAYGFQ